MAKALYYNENLVAREFDVIAEDKDSGTVDIGTGTKVVVAKARVAAEPAVGCVTLGSAPVENAPEDKKKHEPKTK